VSRQSIGFFDSQFRNQVANGQFALNPFEELALPHLHGELLDLGCGLGNLALEAARRGCRVTALDGSEAGIARIREEALGAGLAVEAHQADLLHYRIDRAYDSIVCIGLLMFFPETAARAALADIVRHVRPGGVAVVNVLVEGTSFMGMFEPGHYHLFPRGSVAEAFAGWEIVAESFDTFPAPGDTLKVFDSVIARKPAA
jgi:tellurite methyltransferase